MKLISPTLVRHAALLLPLTLAACSSAPEQPDLAVATTVQDWHTQTPQGVNLDPADAAGTSSLATWWQHWQDPLLNQLVQQVLANNPSLASSGISYRLALLQAGVATAGFRPKGNLSTGISASESDNADSTSANAGLNASWEIDLWGSRRAAREQADANVQKSLEELRAAQVSLIAEVVQAYVNLRQAQQNRALTTESIRLRQQSYDLARWQRQAGLTTELQQAQALTLLRQTESSLPPYEQAELQALQQLQALAGGELGELLAALQTPQSLPSFSAPAGLTIPAEVLRQRPDVQAQEQAVRAQTEAVVLARHQRYPSLGLSGSLSASGETYSDVFDVDAVVARIAANLALVLFDGGVLKQAVRTQQLQLEQSLLAYRSKLLTAQEEVENALTRLASTQRQQQSFAQALASAELSASLSAQQFEAGLLSFSELLDAQTALLNARSALLGNHSNILGSWVQLYRSMGGGWQGLTLPALAFDAAGDTRE